MLKQNKSLKPTSKEPSRTKDMFQIKHQTSKQPNEPKFLQGFHIVFHLMSPFCGAIFVPTQRRPQPLEVSSWAPLDQGNHQRRGRLSKLLRIKGYWISHISHICLTAHPFHFCQDLFCHFAIGRMLLIVSKFNIPWYSAETCSLWCWRTLSQWFCMQSSIHGFSKISHEIAQILPPPKKVNDSGIMKKKGVDSRWTRTPSTWAQKDVLRRCCKHFNSQAALLTIC